MAFAKQKISELSDLKAILTNSKSSADILQKIASVESKTSTKIHNPEVKNRMNNLDESMFNRKSGFSDRIQEQNAEFDFCIPDDNNRIISTNKRA